MAATAVEVFRGNGQPCEKVMLADAAASLIMNEQDAEDKLANRQKVLDDIQRAFGRFIDVHGVAHLNNVTEGALDLVCWHSVDGAFVHPPPKEIPPGGTVAILCKDTKGSGLVYHGEHKKSGKVDYEFNWVLAWANKPDGKEWVHTDIGPAHGPRDEMKWQEIFAKADKKTTCVSYAVYRDYVAVALMIAGKWYVVQGTLRQTDMGRN